MGNEDMDEVIESPHGPLTVSPTSHLETQNVAGTVTTQVNQKAKTLFPPTYPAPRIEMVTPDPFAQQHYHAKEGSGHGIYTGDPRQSVSKSNFPQNSGSFNSRFEALAVPSASSHDNTTTSAWAQVDRIANSSLLPIYQATGSEMENVDESVAPHRIPFTPRRDGSQTKKNPEKSGRDVRAVGDP
jgi:hypothetical protein